MLKDKNPGFVWIGATDEEEEGEWKWTDCNTWNFTKWGSREPNNQKNIVGDGENCALLPKNKDWIDTPCHWKKWGFVCARPMCEGKMFELLCFKCKL